MVFNMFWLYLEAGFLRCNVCGVFVGLCGVVFLVVALSELLCVMCVGLFVVVWIWIGCIGWVWYSCFVLVALCWWSCVFCGLPCEGNVVCTVL